MRKLSVGALMGALSLIVVAVAIGASATSGTTVQTFDQTYSAKKPSKSTGTTFKTTSTDDTNTARNKQPKRVTNFDIAFPKGSKINSKAIAQCKATETDFANAPNPDDACPKGSKIGSGAVAARTPFNGVADFTGTVSAYNANKGLLLFVNVQSANQTLLLKPKFVGLNLKTVVPQTCIPPNIPANDCKDASGTSQEAILTSFNLTTKPAGTKGKALITTPPTCPTGGWTFTASIKYADATSVKIPSKSKCTK
jgi:predicted Zn-ribbon and HTH transcriptional regulator